MARFLQHHTACSTTWHAQALDERRLVLNVSESGQVTHVLSRTPASLFGFAPEELVGLHVCECLDILRPPGAA